MKHLLPFKQEPFSLEIIDNIEGLIADTVSNEVAEFIIQACNDHYKLVKTLEAILETMPPKVSLPLIVQIKELAEKALKQV